jgi:putative phosphoesterase
MIKIGLLSDTHGYIDPKIYTYFEQVDEIWHAGDWGVYEETFVKLKAFKPIVRGVYGNIDGRQIRAEFPEKNIYTVEGLKVAMIHIGGYPGRYAMDVKKWLEVVKPDLFISGHSHILKVIRDPRLQLLHMNPGAAGNVGFHHVRTAIRFSIDAGKIIQPEVIELGPRSLMQPDE